MTRMEGSQRNSCLWGKMLEIGIVFDCINVITEERRQKVTNTHDFLGSHHTREMSTASPIVTSIKDLLYFRMSETTMKDTINTMKIKVIADEKIASGLVSDTSSIITSKMGG